MRGSFALVICPKALLLNDRDRVVEIRAVHQIEYFPPELQRLLFRDAERFERRNIDVCIAGAGENVASRRAKRAKRGKCEARRIEVFPDEIWRAIDRHRSSTGPEPIRSARSPARPERLRLVPAVALKGVPLWRTTMPFSCQPPTCCAPTGCPLTAEDGKLP